MNPALLPMIAAGLALAAPAASGYCVHNDLKDRDIAVLQETHPDWKREDSRFRATIKPGRNTCCKFSSLDCNPNGRQNSLVGLAITIAGEPAYTCGLPAGPNKERQVKVTGGGTLRVIANPKHDPDAKVATAPYLVRIWAHDGQDVTGPAGVACRAP